MVSQPLPTARTRNGTCIDYDSAAGIISLTFPHRDNGVLLNDESDIVRHFADIDSFWMAHCEGRKVYWLLNYENFSAKDGLRDFYTKTLQRHLQKTAITAVRYGGTFQQRATIRFYALRTHQPLHLYADRQEALHVIDELKSGARALTDGK